MESGHPPSARWQVCRDFPPIVGALVDLPNGRVARVVRVRILTAPSSAETTIASDAALRCTDVYIQCVG